MARQQATYQSESMSSIVTSDKADVLNTGVVKSADAQSKSTLTIAQSAAGERKSASRVASRSSKPKPSTGDSAGDADGTSVSDQAANEGPGSRTKAGVFKLNPKTVAAGLAIDQLDESQEFEGVGEARDKAYSARRITQALRGHRAAKTASAAQSAESEGTRKAARAAKAAKKAEGTKKAAQAQAAMQAKASSAAGANAAAAVAEKATTKTLGGAIASAAAPIAGVFAGILAFVIGVLVVAQLLSALFGFWENEALKDTGQLTGVEKEIAAALKEYGFSNESIAAILGNLKAESGMNPASDEVMDGMFNYSYERACGLFQYTSTSPGSGEYWAFKRWCSANGKEWSAVSSQMEWTFSGHCEGTWSNRWSTALARSGYYSNCPGYTGSGWYSASEFPKADDVVKATFSWMACYERPANGQYAHLDRRIEYSKDYLAKLTASSFTGNNVIVAAAYSQLGVPYVWGGSTPGVGLDCSGLTQYCYAQAGIRISHYTESQYAELTPIPLSQAQPGDILYKYGHVAIYIGGDEYIHEPHTGDVCRKATGISYFTCALRHT